MINNYEVDDAGNDNVPHLSHARIIPILIVCIAAFFGSQLFLLFPWEHILWKIHAVYLAILLLFGYFYVLRVFWDRQGQDSILWFSVLIYILFMIYPAIVAKINFGQPVIYGLLAGRHFLCALISLVIFNLLTKNKISVEQISQSFLFVSWCSLSLFIFLAFVTDPLSHVDELRNVGDTVHLGVRFVFNTTFIVYGSIYYFIRLIKSLNWFNVSAFLAFTGYIIVVFKGRMTILTLCAVLFVYAGIELLKRKKQTTLNIFLIFLMFVFLGCLALMICDYDYLNQYSESFLSAYNAMTGEIGVDDSANSRIFQYQKILAYWTGNIDHWLFGTGLLSHQWNDGFKGFFGYFYPADTGILGGVFVYGLAGILLFSLVLFQVLRWMVLSRLEYDSDMIVSMRYYLLFIISISFLNLDILSRSYHTPIIFGVFAYLYTVGKNNVITDNLNGQKDANKFLFITDLRQM